MTQLRTLREAVRIHGPYTHVPYHERIDDGFVNFVNNQVSRLLLAGKGPHQGNIGDGKAHVAELPAGAERMSEAQLVERTLTVILALDGPQAVAWARAHLANSGDRQVLVQQLALTACPLGNDAHNLSSFPAIAPRRAARPRP